MPTLPDKNFTTKLVASSPEFVSDRCSKLDAFLKKTTAHSVLRTSAALATFLEASEEAWAAWTARPQEGLILAKQNGSGSAALKHAANSLLTVPRADEMDVEYERVRSLLLPKISGSHVCGFSRLPLPAAHILHRA